jgi:hypothetical protein
MVGGGFFRPYRFLSLLNRQPKVSQRQHLGICILDNGTLMGVFL